MAASPPEHPAGLPGRLTGVALAAAGAGLFSLDFAVNHSLHFIFLVLNPNNPPSSLFSHFSFFIKPHLH